MQNIDELVEYLYTALARVDNPSDIAKVMEDICTYKEVEQMAQRLKSAELLLEGRTYTEVIHATGISSATLSRVSKCIRKGNGGYKLLVDKESPLS